MLNSGPNALTALQLYQMVSHAKYLNPQTSPFSPDNQNHSGPKPSPAQLSLRPTPYSYPNHHSGPNHPAPLATLTTTQTPTHLPLPIVFSHHALRVAA